MIYQRFKCFLIILKLFGVKKQNLKKNGDYSLVNEVENPKKYNYVIRWLAHKVQFSFKKTKVSINLQGEQGSAKSCVADIFMKIFGDHAKILDTQDAFGTFNTPLLDTLFVFLDEATHNKGDSSKMKRLICDKVNVQKKFFDTIVVDNFIDILQATNKSKADITETSDRNWTLIVSNIFAGIKNHISKRYFDFFYQTSVDDLFNYLKSFDLSDFDPSILPYTKENQDQKIMCLNDVAKYYLDCFNAGAILTSKRINQDDYTVYHLKLTDKILKDDIYLYFQRYYDKSLPCKTFWERLNSIVEYDDIYTFPKNTKKTVTTNVRKLIVTFPELEQARSIFR